MSIGILRASEKVKCRNTIGELNVSVSMSSEPAPYTCASWEHRALA